MKTKAKKMYIGGERVEGTSGRAVALASGTGYGLAGAVFMQNVTRAVRVNLNLTGGPVG